MAGTVNTYPAAAVSSGTGTSAETPKLVTYRAAGLALLGNPADYAVDFSDWYEGSGQPNWVAQTAATGSAATVPTVRTSGGVIRFDTGATINSSYNLFRGGAIGGYMGVGNISTKKWYFANAFAIPVNGVSNTTFLGFGFLNVAGSKTIVAGVAGSGSTTVYGVQYDGAYTGSFLNLTTAIDALYHHVECWGLADGKIYARIDGGATVSATMSSAPTDALRSAYYCKNGASGGNSAVEHDWWMLIVER